jgi:hypothetical protein
VQLRALDISTGAFGHVGLRVGTPYDGGERADGAPDEQLLVADEQDHGRERIGQLVDSDRTGRHVFILSSACDGVRATAAAGAPMPTLLARLPRTMVLIDPGRPVTATSPSWSVRRTGKPKPSRAASSDGAGWP